MAVKQLLIYFQYQSSNVPALAVLVTNDSKAPVGFQGTLMASLDGLFYANSEPSQVTFANFFPTADTECQRRSALQWFKR